MPDLIILDLGLPAGDGITVLQRIRKFASVAATPVILVTGREDQESRGQAISAGATEYLTKPVSKDSLATAVRRLLDLPGASHDAAEACCQHCHQPLVIDALLRDPRVMATLEAAMVQSV